MPFVDRVKPLIDLREQVVTFPPSGVITEDNVDGRDRHGPVLHDHRPQGGDLRGRQPAAGDRAAHRHDAAQRHRLPDAGAGADQPRPGQRAAAHRPRRGHGQVGDPHQPRRAQVGRPARRRSRRRWRSRCAPSATGAPRSSPPRASSSRRSSPPRARSSRRSSRRGRQAAAILRAEGESKAIETVFEAIHEGEPDPELLSYQYLQMLPRIAEGDANKIWVIPSEFTQALGTLGSGSSRPARRRRRAATAGAAGARRRARPGPTDDGPAGPPAARRLAAPARHPGRRGDPRRGAPA